MKTLKSFHEGFTGIRQKKSLRMIQDVEVKPTQLLPKDWRYTPSQLKDLIIGDVSKGITIRSKLHNIEIHLEGGVNRCKANLVTSEAELKTKCNILNVTKEFNLIPSEGLWTISSLFL